MISMAVAQGSQWILRGCLAGGLLCGVAFAAPPSKEKAKPAPAAAAAPKPEKKVAQPQRNSGGGSVLGSVIQLFAGEPAAAPAPQPAPARAATVIAVDALPVAAAEEAEEVAAPVAAARPGKQSQPWNLPGATHKQTQTVKIAKQGGNGLQTFCVTPKGELVAVVGPPRHGAATGKDGPTSELQMFDGDGNPLRKWTVDFGVQAVTSTPDGAIVAAGSGHVAKFSAEGDLTAL